VTAETNAACSISEQLRSVVAYDTATITSKSFNIDGAELGRSVGTVDILGSRLGRLLRLG